MLSFLRGAVLLALFATSLWPDTAVAARPLTTRERAARRRPHTRAGRGRFVGRGVARSELLPEAPPRPSGRVVVRSSALGEGADVVLYDAHGGLDQAALARLDDVFRCRLSGEARAIDPRLYEMLSRIYDHYGKTIEVVSGFRYQRDEASRHFHGSAIDISVPGVDYDELYHFAMTLDAGGMGIGRYPRSQFVHIDFRAPGEPSYRWTDTRKSNGGDPGKEPSKMWLATSDT